ASCGDAFAEAARAFQADVEHGSLLGLATDERASFGDAESEIEHHKGLARPARPVSDSHAARGDDALAHLAPGGLNSHIGCELKLESLAPSAIGERLQTGLRFADLLPRAEVYGAIIGGVRHALADGD